MSNANDIDNAIRNIQLIREKLYKAGLRRKEEARSDLAVKIYQAITMERLINEIEKIHKKA